jgi:putative transcriptional regulator
MKRVVISGTNPRFPVGETDWARVNAMTEEEITAAALSDPDCPPLTDEQLARFKRVNAVKVIRRRLDMTQAQFAAAFQLPLSTVRDWEQERSYPDAPARALLTAIARDPETMRRLIGGQAA